MSSVGPGTAALDPSLFGAKPPTQCEAAEPEVLEKGEAVWYQHRSGAWMKGKVTAVDKSSLPPFYQVCNFQAMFCRTPHLQLGGSGSRLTRMQEKHQKQIGNMAWTLFWV
jgi:hypothetical protein